MLHFDLLLLPISAHHSHQTLEAQLAITIVMSMTTDSLVADIRKMSNESDFKTLITKLESSQEHIAQLSNAVLDTVIECLDVRNHSLGVMAAL